MKNLITEVFPRLILDSRGIPTVEIELTLSDGSKHRASVPSGKSTGLYEAYEMRDNDDPKRYKGKGVIQTLVNLELMLAPLITGYDPTDQKRMDMKIMEIDGTYNFSRIGANSVLALSIATLKAGAYVKKLPLYKYINEILREHFEIKFEKSLKFPTPMFNLLNGGLHAGNNIAFQEFMAVPLGINDIREQIRAGAEVMYALHDILKEKKLSTQVGDEGGYAPNLKCDEEAIELLMDAIKLAGYDINKHFRIAIDAAVSQYYNKEYDQYNVPHQKVGDSLETISGDFRELTKLYINWIEKYPVFSIEDGFDQDDWKAFSTLNALMNVKKGLCVGDDLVATNIIRLDSAISTQAINAVIIKPNQNGCMWRVFDVIKMCKENDIKTIVSHRSGDTADTFISHLAVGSQSEFIKSGALQRSERNEKYNELLRMIEPGMIKK